MHLCTHVTCIYAHAYVTMRNLDRRIYNYFYSCRSRDWCNS